MQKISKYFTGVPVWAKALVFLVLFLVLVVLSGVAGAMFPREYSTLMFGILGCISGAGVVWLFNRIDPGTWSLSGMVWHRKSIPKFLTGIFIGLAVFMPLIGALIIFSPLEIKPSADSFDHQALILLLPILPLALMEEIAFRSYPQQLLARKYGIWISQFSMALVFGFFHILYGWNPVTAFTGPFVWAFLFGVSAIISRGIAVPTGIHFSLNVLQVLTGLKGKDQYTFFELDYPPGTAKAAIEATEQLGFGLHAILFMVFVLATYLYQRRLFLQPRNDGYAETF